VKKTVQKFVLEGKGGWGPFFPCGVWLLWTCQKKIARPGGEIAVIIMPQSFCQQAQPEKPREMEA
jgi:hypothetical protein